MNDQPPDLEKGTPRFGPLLKWILGLASLGFLWGCVRNMFTRDGADFWYPDAVFLSCLGAVAGLIAGLVHDIARSIHKRDSYRAKKSK